MCRAKSAPYCDLEMSTAATSKPRKKAVAELLTAEQQNLTKDVQSRSGIILQNVVYSLFPCPKGSNCKDNGRVTFEKESIFRNPYRYLTTCIAGGHESHLLQIYYSTLAEYRSHRIQIEQFSPNPTIPMSTSKENAMHAYLKLLFVDDYAILHVCNE